MESLNGLKNCPENQKKTRHALHWYGRATTEPNEAERFLFLYTAFETLCPGKPNGDKDILAFWNVIKPTLATNLVKPSAKLNEIQDIRNDLVHEGKLPDSFPNKPFSTMLTLVLSKRIGFQHFADFADDVRELSEWLDEKNPSS